MRQVPKEGTLSQGLAALAPFLVICPQGRALCWHEGRWAM